LQGGVVAVPRAASVASSSEAEPRTVEHRVLVLTGGACRSNRDNRFRRAGSGISLVRGGPKNLADAAPGCFQTDQRAELLLVLMTLQREPRPVEIRTDSRYVRDRATAWRTWRETGWRVDHLDFLGIFSKLLANRHALVSFVKVQGHAEDWHVRRGLVEAIDKVGNDGADALATAAADARAAPRLLVQRASARQDMARAMDIMMLRVLGCWRNTDIRLGLYDFGSSGVPVGAG
jgi:ribonuclease HI